MQNYTEGSLAARSITYGQLYSPSLTVGLVQPPSLTFNYVCLLLRDKASVLNIVS